MRLSKPCIQQSTMTPAQVRVLLWGFMPCIFSIAMRLSTPCNEQTIVTPTQGLVHHAGSPCID